MKLMVVASKTKSLMNIICGDFKFVATG